MRVLMLGCGINADGADNDGSMQFSILTPQRFRQIISKILTAHTHRLWWLLYSYRTVRFGISGFSCEGSRMMNDRMNEFCLECGVIVQVSFCEPIGVTQCCAGQLFFSHVQYLVFQDWVVLLLF